MHSFSFLLACSHVACLAAGYLSKVGGRSFANKSWLGATLLDDFWPYCIWNQPFSQTQMPKRTILCLFLVITLSEPAALTQLSSLLWLNPTIADQHAFISVCSSLGQGCLFPWLTINVALTSSHFSREKFCTKTIPPSPDIYILFYWVFYGEAVGAALLKQSFLSFCNKAASGGCYGVNLPLSGREARICKVFSGKHQCSSVLHARWSEMLDLCLCCRRRRKL